MESWLDKQESLYSNYKYNAGRPSTFREILLSAFDKDLSTLISLRKLDRANDDGTREKLKSMLQCYTPGVNTSPGFADEKKNLFELAKT